jgi:hypothetical protein
MRSLPAGLPGQLWKHVWRTRVCSDGRRWNHYADQSAARGSARRVENLPVEEAIIRIGLDVQYYCIADPAGWDPIYGKSPVHLAGKFHTAALKKALKYL